MAITVTLTVSPFAPDHGATVTATYAVQGNTGTPAQVAQVDGGATIGGLDLDVATVLTIPAVAPESESFDRPTCPGLTFEPTADPAVWTALVP